MATPCEKCQHPGPSCGYGHTAADLDVCVGGCGAFTRIRSRCGAARRYQCSGQPEPRGSARLLTGAARPEPAVETSTSGDGGWKVAEARRLAHGDHRPQPDLRLELAAADLDPAAVGRGVVLWNRLMNGMHYTGAHNTARILLNSRLQGAPTPHNPEWLAPLTDEPVWSARTWTTPYPGETEQAAGWFRTRFGEGADLAAYDVNGAWPSAAASDLPVGEPEYIPAGEPVASAYPGYVRADELDGAPHGIQSRWQPGMWMPTPIINYLISNALLTCGPSIVWPETRRWLDPHVDLYRQTRAALIAEKTPEALALLKIVGGVFQRMFGGLLSSERYNPGPTFQPVWAGVIPATAQARMFRNMDKVRGGACTPVGVHVDAVWYALPRAWADPPGLPVSPQLGKFKPTGRIPWTDALSAAWAAQEPETIRKALSDAKQA